MEKHDELCPCVACCWKAVGDCFPIKRRPKRYFLFIKPSPIKKKFIDIVKSSKQQEIENSRLRRLRRKRKKRKAKNN